VIDQLPNAQVLVTRTEYEWARAPDGMSALGYCAADYVKPGVDWVMLEEIDDGWDLYGDGCVRCWRTPGHTPGHMALEVRLGSGACYLLAADAANTMAHVEEKVLPGFSLDMVVGARSIRRLRRLADRAQATIIPGHDPDLWPTLKHAPAYYV
jgi:glyoxylase-like metal-dependent hydrolase (beta-lactamase superfamily II)